MTKRVIFLCNFVECLITPLGLQNSLLMGLGQDHQQYPAVHTGGVNRGRFVALAVGNSDM